MIQSLTDELSAIWTAEYRPVELTLPVSTAILNVKQCHFYVHDAQQTRVSFVSHPSGKCSLPGCLGPGCYHAWVASADLKPLQ